MSDKIAVRYAVAGITEKKVTVTLVGAQPKDDLVVLQVWGKDEEDALRKCLTTIKVRKASDENQIVKKLISDRLDLIEREAKNADAERLKKGLRRG